MELRNHSQMIWQGHRNWPPKWTGPHNSENPLPEGEVGFLREWETTDPSLIAPHCILVIRYGNEDYVGSLFFNDEEFVQKICRVLNDHIGLSISKIGSLVYLSEIPTPVVLIVGIVVFSAGRFHESA